MKTIQSLILLCLIATGTAFAQNFTILSPSSKVIQLIGGMGEMVRDSVTIHNNTSAALTVTTTIIGDEVWAHTYDRNSTIPANGTASMAISMGFSVSCSGDHSAIAIFSDGTTTDTVTLQGVTKSMAVGAQGGRQTLCMQNVPVGQSACRPVYAKNIYKEPLIISGFGFVYGNYSKTLEAKPNGPLPIVLLPGEEAQIATICYTPTAVNSHDFEWLTVNRSPVNEGGPSDNSTSIDISCSSAADTNLLKPCVVASVDTNLLGPVLIGGSISKTITLTNNRYSSQTISDVSFTYGDAPIFSVDHSAFPMTIGALSSNTFTLTFSPPTSDSIIKYRYAVGIKVASDSSDCETTGVDIAGLAMLPTADSIASPLFPNQTQYLGMSSSTQISTKVFHFQNTTSNTVKVMNVSFATADPALTITDITPTTSLPFTLAPNDKMTVTVSFSAVKANQVTFNNLIISTDKSLMQNSFPFQALWDPNTNLAVTIAPTLPVTFSVIPNPASGMITCSVSNAAITQAEIYDLLGNKLIEQAQKTSQWAWDVRTLGLASGSYFIRVSGVTPAGESVVKTSKLIVE